MSFRKITEVTIDGKKWELGYGYPGKTDGKVNDGICNWSRRRIVIQRRARGRLRRLADVLAHELGHAIIPSMDEDYVELLGKVIGEAYEAFEKHDHE
jgi:hypothetical protein